MNPIYLLALTRISGVGPLTARALLAHFGTAEAVFKATLRQLMHVNGIGLHIAQNIRQCRTFDACAHELAQASKNQVQVLAIGDVAYPKRLLECEDAPILLFYSGTANLNAQKIISVVGTRNATAYGKALCDELINHLAPYEPLIVSGLAYGIDGAAHKACLRYGLATVGVLAHGLDRIYPQAHHKMAQEMLELGGLLTEYPFQTKPDRENFPKRNRIIAGLADATIVVEANVKGGALITAELANSYNREVFAYPGRVNDVYSSGCLELLKCQKAQLISEPADLLHFMAWDDKKASKTRQIEIPLDLSAAEKTVLTLLKKGEKPTIDALVHQAKIPQPNVLSVLLSLEMKGLIKTLPGNRYSLLV